MTSSTPVDSTTTIRSTESKSNDDNRLWIGNLDSKLTEGYAFVTFSTADGADTCLQKLNGRKIFDRTVSVRWAQQTQFANNDDEEKLRQKLPALGINAVTEPKVSKERTISAIEAKLKAMEREKDQNSNFSLGNKSASTSSMPHNFVQNYPYASSRPAYHPRDSYRARSRPYSSNRGRKRF